ncbi:MAG: hypothetical protein Q9207_003052 [Kuettlingeria erythrocarpa]
MDAAPNGHAMATRSRPGPSGTLSQPQVTFPSLNEADIPYLTPSTPSRKSNSPAKLSSKSPRKSRSPAKSRSRSPSKTDTSNGSKATTKLAHLAFLQPMITFEETSEIKGDGVPEAALRFWRDYMVPVKDEETVIPSALKASRPQVPESSYGPNLFNVQDAMEIHAQVTKIVELAKENRGRSHEPDWVSTVVGPLITLLETLPSMMSSHKERRVKALTISSVSIQPRELCPSSDLLGVVDRKIDHALAINLTKDEQRSLQTAGAMYRVAGEPSINQTSAFAFMLMFLHFEVKVDARDPLIQLGVWIAAELEKRFREGYPMDVPIPAVAIYGDTWHLWLAFAISLSTSEKQKAGKAYRVQFIGPVVIGSTHSYIGVYKIIHIMKAVIKWGLTVYQRDYVERILATYKKKK